MAGWRPTDNQESYLTAGLEPRELLRRQTGEARQRQVELEAQIAQRSRQPPEPGDLFVFAETAEHDVEWAILERDPADSRRLLAVPADTCSLAGSADVAVGAGKPRDDLTLRCGHPVWLDAETLDPGLRTGALEASTVERARQRLALVESGAAIPSVRARDVDDEAEYRNWIEIIEQARAAVPSLPAADASDSEGGGKVVPFDRSSRWSSTSTVLAIAASVLLAMTFGLGRELRETTREHQAAVAERLADLAQMVRERQQLLDDHQQELAELQEAQRRADAENRERIAELEAAAGPRAMVNLPLAILAASPLRGNVDTLGVAPDASSLMLILQLDDPDAYPMYQLDIFDRSTRRRIWRNSRLQPSQLSELTVLLPRNLMPDGRYEVRLHGLLDGAAEKLMERILAVETRPRRSR